MLQIDKTIVSGDVLEKKFLCDLSKCKGACCVMGDAGAPLEEDEVEILDSIFEKVKPYLSPEGVAAIESQGTHVIDEDGDRVTPLIDGKECAFTVFESGIAKCGIEKAWLDKAVTFRKPLSCHLYPIRINKFRGFDGVNYHQWDICQPGRELGERENLPLHVFLQEPITRAYGEEYYAQLEHAAKHSPLGSEDNL